MRAEFPNHRHLLIGGEAKLTPAKVLKETPFAFETPMGIFDKATLRKCGDPNVGYIGPFTAEGDMENRP
ncbi:hypothetical protein EN759_04175 [Mesorhizobium sp. M00.F.Ca.ET.038.03.1.1]|nr:hypothetical protein EN759_04175 [Mesorhizobium sp. M00.F.Ca.ET.038.03.1.1]